MEYGNCHVETTFIAGGYKHALLVEEEKDEIRPQGGTKQLTNKEIRNSLFLCVLNFYFSFQIVQNRFLPLCNYN